MTVKTRFAPSPTGWLHLGNLRTALFNVLLARGRGDFLLRIEDTDAERSRSEYIDDLQEDLIWLGLTWNEGPACGGDHGPYQQSQRGSIYQDYYERLEQAGLAYPCFCTEQELKLTRRRQLQAGQAPRYPGTCAHLSVDEATSRRAAGREPTLRFRVPKGESVEFEDLVRGPQKFQTDDIGDFIIRRGNGSAAFFFCNAIDDALMSVTHVLRGEDHLANTPRQLLMLKALGLATPSYGHISMIVGADGAPLSKRHGSRSIRELRKSGYLPEAIINYLARLGHHFEDVRLMSLDELASQFESTRLGRSPARYDGEQLNHWQREAIMQATSARLVGWMGSALSDVVPANQMNEFVDVIRGNVMLPEHGVMWAKILFDDALELSYVAQDVIKSAGVSFFEVAMAAVEQHGADFKLISDAIKSQLGVKGKGLFQPLRASLTGELDGPEMTKIVPLMNSARARRRFQAALEIAR